MSEKTKREREVLEFYDSELEKTAGELSEARGRVRELSREFNQLQNVRQAVAARLGIETSAPAPDSRLESYTNMVRRALSPGRAMRVKEVHDAVLSEGYVAHYDAVAQALQRMVVNEEVVRVSRGVYEIPERKEA